MKLMTFVYIGIAIVFLATIIIMLLQKYSPTKGKRQTRRGIIALACWGLGIALIFFGTEHYMASAASIVIVAAIIVIMLRAIGKMTEGMSPEEAEATLIESQENSYNSVFAGCDSAEKREDGYHYELTVIWTSGEGYEQRNNYRHGTMHLTSNEDYLIQGRVYYLNTEALAARGLFKEECLAEGGLDITGINPGAFTDGGTVGATVMNLALRAYEGPQTEAEASDNPDYTKLKLDYSYNGEKYESSFDVSTENLYAYSDTVYVTVKNDNPAKITSISTTGNKSLKSFKSMRNMGKIFEYVICGIFFVVGITLAVKGFRAKGN